MGVAWESSVWGFFNIMAVLLMSLLLANALKREIKWLADSLIPTSVLGGTILLVIAIIYQVITKEILWDTVVFAGRGSAYLEMTTYHTLALGFIASTLKTTKTHLNKRRNIEIFNTGITTVSTYLMQGMLGLVITITACIFLPKFFEESGLLLAFGFGQGTGQAMNYGNIYDQWHLENEGVYTGGMIKSIGLTIAAVGFLVASLGGVIHLNVLKRRGKFVKYEDMEEVIDMEEVHTSNDIPMQGSVDKLSIQLALVTFTYFVAYIMMTVLGSIISGMRDLIFGFNFLLGVLAATMVKLTINYLKSKDIIKKEYANNFLLTRLSNFFFDLMVVAGIAAIRLDILGGYIGVVVIVCVVGMISTYAYNRFVAKKLFGRYKEEQFMMMYGMLTGTASTGTILLRELDPEMKSPAAENIIYQNFPAIIFGFPLMILANMCPKRPVLTLIILAVMFIVMNIILFREQIFKRRFKKVHAQLEENARAARQRKPLFKKREKK